jgi:proteasome alpha subunit
MQFYASPEQIMRDRSEFARKNIARGRGVVVLTYEGGVLFVAETVSTTLHKVSEIYDRIGFAAVGRYNEFENLRAAGVRMADLRGYAYDRRDVTARALANAYAQMLGAIFGEQGKPFEVELCLAEVGATPEADEFFRLTYDGSVQDEPGFMAMGGQADVMASSLRGEHRLDLSLPAALRLAVNALGSVGGEGGQPRALAANQLEVAVLDRRRPGRTFRRIVGNAMVALLEQARATESPAAESSTTPPAETRADETGGPDGAGAPASPGAAAGEATPGEAAAGTGEAASAGDSAAENRAEADDAAAKGEPEKPAE